MGWLTKRAYADKVRMKDNIQRLQSLRTKVHDLSFFVVSSQSGGFQVLKDLLEDRLVLGRPKVHNKLLEALISENNQKMALDAPIRFQGIMQEAVNLIDREIGIEAKALKKRAKETDDPSN